LPAQIAAAQRTAAFAEILRGVDAGAVSSRQALAQLPVTRKHELLERQKAQRGSDPFGGFSAIGWRGQGAAARGAARVPVARADLRARGHAGRRLLALRPRAVRRRLSRRRPGAQQLQLPPHAGRVDDGKRRGMPSAAPSSRAAWATPSCSCRRWLELRADAYAGTPSFLRIALEKADETGVALPGLRKASVGGEAFPAALRDAAAAHAASTPTRATARPTSASSPTRPRRARAWCSTKA
jgi:phenylacetate-CoA ligase